jgi:hypothetical protein
VGEGEGQEAFGRRRGVTEPADNRPPGAEPARDDADEARGAGLRVVYCGGCNPQIDRGAVASELEAAPAFARPGSLVYLSGCPRACASGHQLATDDEAIVVAGAHVDGVLAPAEGVAAAVIDKLKE